jgi:hypothetical protein
LAHKDRDNRRHCLILSVLHLRINKMIITVVIFYLLTEFSNQLIFLYNAISLDDILVGVCLDSIVRILFVFAYLNPCMNTLFYLLMSSQYQRVFKSLFRSSVRLPTRTSPNS